MVSAPVLARCKGEKNMHSGEMALREYNRLRGGGAVWSGVVPPRLGVSRFTI